MQYGQVKDKNPLHLHEKRTSEAMEDFKSQYCVQLNQIKTQTVRQGWALAEVSVEHITAVGGCAFLEDKNEMTTPISLGINSNEGQFKQPSVTWVGDQALDLSCPGKALVLSMHAHYLTGSPTGAMFI